MFGMQAVLRSALAGTLSGLTPLDRLAAIWPVVAGHAIAERSAVTAFDHGAVTVTAESSTWQRQLIALRSQLQADLARVSRMPVTDILFLLPSQNVPGQPQDDLSVRQRARGKLL